MRQDSGISHATPAFRIQRAARGYRVVGPGLLLWEATLVEAVERREELEGGRRRFPPGEPPDRSAEASGGIVYGPVASRRLGRSLGIDLLPPGVRVCSFDCIYCSVGGSRSQRPRRRWPTPPEVGTALRRALVSAGPLDSITISGHGEPTLHPHFSSVVERIRDAADGSGVPVRILTNGSRIPDPCVRSALDRLDERIVKLDANPERTERPGRESPLGGLIAALLQLRDVTIQSCFVAGPASNRDEASVGDWLEVLGEVRPRAVQIYTIDERARAGDVLPVSAAELEEIACRLRASTGIDAGVFA